MKLIQKYAISGLILMAASCASQPPVAPVTIGNQVDFGLLEDQFGHRFVHGQAMEMVLYVNSMKSKNLVRGALHEIDSACLNAGRVVYLADISAMPSLISKLIAVPKLREYNYPVWLDYSGLATAPLPVKDDWITVLTVKDGALSTVSFVADAETLLLRLVPVCGLASQRVALQVQVK